MRAANHNLLGSPYSRNSEPTLRRPSQRNFAPSWQPVESYPPGEEPQQVLVWTGLDYMALRRYDDAVASLTTALSRDRPTPELLYRLGEAQYRSGRGQEAAAALRQALAIDPQHSASRQLLSGIQVARQGGPAVQR